MIKRRTLIHAFGAVGGATVIAGCSGAESTDSSEAEAESEPPEEVQTQDQEQDQEQDTQQANALPNITVGSINLTYGFSSGLRARIQLTNEAEEETQSVYTQIEAYGDDGSIGSDSTWEDLAAGFSSEVDLNIESIGSLSDYDIDDVTEFVITGRLRGGESETIETFSGEALRERVDE